MVVIRPGQDLDNELELETQLPKFVDMSRLPLDHRIDIHLRELPRNYPLVLEKIRKICTRGGTRFYAKDSTFHDPIHLGFVLRFIYRKVATSFFFLKEDIYVMALCRSGNVRVGSNWVYAKGTKVMIEGSKYAGFGVDYGRLEHCMVGILEIRQALLQLSLYNDVYNDGANFLKIAHHISEAVRNKEVEDIISESFRIGEDLPIDHLIPHFHNWQAYTKLWCTRYFQLNSQKQKRYLERFRLLRIKNIDHLNNMLQILCMENQEIRMERRSIALGLYSQGSVSHDSIVKRTTNVALRTAQQLQVHREAILNELMRSGGDPRELSIRHVARNTGFVSIVAVASIKC